MRQLTTGILIALGLATSAGTSQDLAAALQDARQKAEAFYAATGGRGATPASGMIHGSLGRVIDALKRAESAPDAITRDPLDQTGRQILRDIYSAAYDVGTVARLPGAPDKALWHGLCPAVVKVLIATPYVKLNQLHPPDCPGAAADLATAADIARKTSLALLAERNAELARNPPPAPRVMSCQAGNGAFPHDCHSQPGVLRNPGPFYLAITRNATYIDSTSPAGSYRRRGREGPAESPRNKALYDRLRAAGVPLRPADAAPGEADYPSIDVEVLLDSTPGSTVICGLATRQAEGSFSYSVGLSINEMLELPGRSGTRYPVTTWRRFQTGSAPASERKDLEALIYSLLDDFAKDYKAQNPAR
jgi:hypothetical protein